MAVIGLGAIGLIACQLAKRAGASTVIAVDPIVKRREVALALGADLVLDSLQCDVGLEIKKATGKIGCDQIIETSGNMHALQASIKGLAYGGTIAYVAFAKPFPQGLWLGQEAHFNNGKIVFSRASSEPNPDYPRWNRKRIEDTCWQMLSQQIHRCRTNHRSNRALSVKALKHSPATSPSIQKNRLRWASNFNFDRESYVTWYTG